MDLEKVINKIVDKSKWKTYRFDELVKNIVEKVVPKGSGLEHYIGLEHLDSGSVHIKRFGETESLIGDKLKIYKGDIIFAKRNAYLKRASISPIDGVASAHSLVLRMNDETVDKRFFPFFLMSEYFWERAIEISVGSLSPTINWKTLAKQEFLLPPKEQQAELADLLWAMDDVIEKDLVVLERLEINKNRLSFDTFRLNKITRKFDFQDIECKNLFQTNKEIFRVPLGWNTSLLKDLVDIANSGFAEGKRDDNGNPQLRMNNVTRDGRLNLAEIAYIPFKANAQKYTIKANDVIFCNTNSDDLVGKTVLADRSIENFYFSNHFTRLVCNDKMLNGYLYLYLKFLFDIGLFQRICVKWIGQAAVQLDSLLNLELLVPSIEEQEMVTKRYNDFLVVQEELEAKLQYSKALQKSLINQIF